MTNEQKLQIEDMRKQSCGYSVIARTLNLSVSAVKGYCQRNHLDGFRAETPATVVVQETSVSNGDFCKQCGKTLVQKNGASESGSSPVRSVRQTSTFLATGMMMSSRSISLFRRRQKSSAGYFRCTLTVFRSG